MAVMQTNPESAVVASLPLEQAAGAGRLKRFANLLLENRKAAVGLAIVLAFILVGLVGPFLVPYDPSQIGVGDPMQGPSAHHWLGTTRLGQDLFSQLVVGTRNSLLVGLGVGVFSTIIAIVIGMTAGYLGGWIDDLLMLFTNVFLILPFFPLAIVAASYAQAFNIKGITVIVVVLTLTGWAWAARVKRSQTLSLRSKDFIQAAKVSGEPWPRIILFEIMPNMAALVAASFIFSVIFAVLGEAGLEFIGLGDINAITWGTILYWAQNNQALLLDAWYWFVPPGLCIGVFAVGLTLLQYGIDEMTNPRLKARRIPKVRGARTLKPTSAASITQVEGSPDATIA
jgi:peptide/nickel transport system permease protein